MLYHVTQGLDYIASNGSEAYARIEATLSSVLLPRVTDITDAEQINSLQTSLKESHRHMKQVIEYGVHRLHI